MRRVQDLSISVKLGLLALMSAVVVGISGAVAIAESGRVASAGATVVQMDQLNLSVTQGDVQHSNAQLALRDAALGAGNAERQQAVSDQKDIAAQISAIKESESETLPGAPGDVRSAVSGLQSALSDYMTAVQPATVQLAALPAGAPQAQSLFKADSGRVAAVDAKTNTAEDLLAKKVANAADTLRSAQSALRTAVILALLFGIVLIATVSLLIARSITRPVAQMVEALRALARKDLTITVDMSRRDEIGLMARALGEALNGLRATITHLGGSATTLGTAARELDTVSAAMQASAHVTAQRADQVSTSAGEVSTGANTMAAATEEMSASILDIAQNATSAAEVAQAAVREAAETSSAMERLGQASSEIGEIVRSITAIAEQTNLLALNATIEAARAGESGKGFAVVASEVKDLAQATAQATQDIARKIEAIQTTAAEATQAMNGIGTVVNRMNEYQTMIAAAVEEQSATTSELTRNVTDVAGSAGAIAINIGQMAVAAGTTSDSASSTQQAAGRLGVTATQLQELVSQFRT